MNTKTLLSVLSIIILGFLVAACSAPPTPSEPESPPVVVVSPWQPTPAESALTQTTPTPYIRTRFSIPREFTTTAVADTTGVVWLLNPRLTLQHAIVVTSASGQSAVLLAPSVMHCHHVVISTHDVNTEITVEVAKEMHEMVPIRLVTFVPGEGPRWGCKVGETVIWSSITRYGECYPTEYGNVVDITHYGGDEIAALLVSSQCYSLGNTKMVWVDTDGRVVNEREVDLQENWINFGSFICAGGYHPEWHQCIDTRSGQPVNPDFPDEKEVVVP